MAQQTYLSPKRYTLGGYGIDTSPYTNAQLRQKLVAATGAVDTWCNVNLRPQRADLRGGTIVGEQHAWPVQSPLYQLPGGRRVYLSNGPIISIQSFAIQFTNTWEMTLPPSNLFINSTEGYIEIVATQPAILGYPPIGLWYGLSEPVCAIDYTYGWQFVVDEDTCEADTPRLYYASHGNWLPGGTVTVSVDGSVVAPAGYAVNEDDGSILFTAATEPGVNDEVLASYTYTLPQQVPDAVGITATASMGEASIARRGMIGLSSLKVAEVSLTQMQPYRGGRGGVTQNGVTIPAEAAALLGSLGLGRVA